MFGLAQLSDLMRFLVAAAADRQDLDDVVLQEPVHQSVLRSTDPDRQPLRFRPSGFPLAGSRSSPRRASFNCDRGTNSSFPCSQTSRRMVTRATERA